MPDQYQYQRRPLQGEAYGEGCRLGKLTILELNRHRLVGAFHQKSSMGSLVSLEVWRAWLSVLETAGSAQTVQRGEGQEGEGGQK
jgi:hypothetical protein